MKTHQLDDQQHATVIAALRFYQSQFQTVSRDRDAWIEELATNAGTVEALSDEGVDNLIESLQFEGEDKLAAFKADFDATLAAMTDEELVASFAATGACILTGTPGEDPEDCSTHEHEEDDEDFEDDNECSNCGDPTDDGEGYDGLCGPCADRAVAAAAKRGMAANPRPTNHDAPGQPT